MYTQTNTNIFREYELYPNWKHLGTPPPDQLITKLSPTKKTKIHAYKLKKAHAGLAIVLLCAVLNPYAFVCFLLLCAIIGTLKTGSRVKQTKANSELVADFNSHSYKGLAGMLRRYNADSKIKLKLTN